MTGSEFEQVIKAHYIKKGQSDAQKAYEQDRTTILIVAISIGIILILLITHFSSELDIANSTIAKLNSQNTTLKQENQALRQQRAQLTQAETSLVSP